MFPRAFIFTEDVMALVVLLDSVKSPIVGSREFRKSMFKRELDGCYSRRTLPSGYTTTVSATKSTSAKRKGYQTIQCEEQGRRKITTAMRVLEASNRRNLLRTLNKDSGKKQARLSPLSSSPDQAISPFEIPFVHRDASVYQWYNFYELLKKGEVVQLEWEWFVHSEPRKISIFGWALRAAIIPGGYFTINIIDAILRVYLSRDNGMYLLNPKRWRHFIAATWTDVVLHGSYGTEMLYQSKYFVGPHILYELRHCRMFPAPVNLDVSWSCYFWDLLNKEIIVLDPQMRLCKGTDIHKHHGGAFKVLHKALFLVIDRLFRMGYFF